jgi:hypothetical protein
MAGCSGRLNERAGLTSNHDLPVLHDDLPSTVRGEPSVTGHDRSHWPATVVTLARDNVTHHPTYIGQPAPAFSPIAMDGAYPSHVTALVPERDNDFPLLSGLHESAFFLLDVLSAPVRMIFGDLPQDAVQSPGGAYARTPDDSAVGAEESIFEPPHQRSLARTFERVDEGEVVMSDVEHPMHPRDDSPTAED